MSAGLALRQPIPAAVAAQWLFDRFVTPAQVATDPALTESLIDAFVSECTPLGRIPAHDLEAVRLALRQLHEETP